MTVHGLVAAHQPAACLLVCISPAFIPPHPRALAGLLTGRHVTRVKSLQDLAGLMVASDKTKVGRGLQSAALPQAARALFTGSVHQGLRDAFAPSTCLAPARAGRIRRHAGLRCWLTPTLRCAARHLQVVLVTDKKQTPPMFRSLSQRFAGQGLLFAEVHRDATTADLLASYGVTKTPTLVALPAGPGPEDKIMYQGERPAQQLREG